MQKLFDHFKTNAGVWTFGLFMAAIAGGIYQFTVFMVSAQVTPVSERVDAEVKRLDAADGNTNIRIADFKEHMDERFDELKRGVGDLKEDVKRNRERIDLLDKKIERKIEFLDRKISRLDAKIDKKFDLLDAKMDEKFNLILLRLPPLKK